MQLPDKSVGEAPKKEIKQIVPSGSAVKVSRPATKRFFDFLFAESPKDLAKRVGRELVVPRIKAGFEEAANSFLAGMLWGGGQRPPSNIVPGAVMRSGAVNYTGVSTQNAMLAARSAVVPAQTGGNYQDLVVPTQQYAEALLSNMYDLLNTYRVGAVADLYEAAGLSPSISDNSYGWTSLEGATIRRVANGYVLELPRPTLI